MQYKNDKQPASRRLSKETASFVQDLLKEKNLSRRVQQEVQDSLKGSTGSWVDLVNSQTASFQPPASQAAQLVRVPKPTSKQKAGPSSPPVFRPSIRLQQQIQATQTIEQEQEQWEQQRRRASCKPAVNREAEKDHLAAVFALGREGATALQQASHTLTKAAAAAAKQKTAAPVKEQMIDQVIEELNARTQLLHELHQQGGTAAAEQSRLLKGEIQQRVQQLRRLGVTAEQA